MSIKSINSRMSRYFSTCFEFIDFLEFNRTVISTSVNFEFQARKWGNMENYSFGNNVSASLAFSVVNLGFFDFFCNNFDFLDFHCH